MYISKAQKELLEQSRSFGLRSGISILVHGSRGETAMLSLAIDSDDADAGRFDHRSSP